MVSTGLLVLYSLSKFCFSMKLTTPLCRQELSQQPLPWCWRWAVPCTRVDLDVSVSRHACTRVCGTGERRLALCYGVSTPIFQASATVSSCSPLSLAALSTSPPALPHGVPTLVMNTRHSFSEPSPNLPPALPRSCAVVSILNPPSAGLHSTPVHSSPWGSGSIWQGASPQHLAQSPAC